MFNSFSRLALGLQFLSVCGVEVGGHLMTFTLPNKEDIWGQFYKSFTLVIYKCSYCFQQG